MAVLSLGLAVARALVGGRRCPAYYPYPQGVSSAGVSSAVLAALHQTANGGHHLGGHLVGVALGGAPAHTVPGMSVEKAEGDLIQGRLDRRDLRKYVDAVAVVVNH